MGRNALAIAGIVICTAFLLTALSLALSADVTRMTKDELKTLIDKGDVMVVDVRTGRDWKASEFKIHTAVREDPGQVASWANKYSKDNTLVLYCA
jgi:rhodanese-related sulfurtransferase